MDKDLAIEFCDMGYDLVEAQEEINEIIAAEFGWLGIEEELNE